MAAQAQLDPMARETRPATREEMPVIDLGALLAGEEGAAAALGPQIREAAESTGFFFITSTGVEPQLEALLGVTKRYFDTAEEERIADCGVDTYQRGFVANGRDQQPGIPPDLKESFDMGVDLPRSHHAVADGVPMHGPNQWPSRCPWLRGPTEDYFEVLRALGEKLLGAFACSVGEPEGFFEEMVDEAMVQMRMFRYFPLPEDSATYGSFEHTDYGMFTLLSPDPIGGLELKTRSGEWVAAPYIENSLVVNIGDMFARWTNGIFQSTPHRVLGKPLTNRYSVAMFFHLNANATVRCLPSCCSAEAPAKYEPIPYLEHLVFKFNQNLKAKF